MAVILLIEDDSLLRSVLTAGLARAGHEVLVAANGLEAEKILAGHPLDLILTDIFMPERDGFETLTRLHATGRRTPVIAMSGYMEDTALFLKAARAMGARRVLEKPFSVESLLTTVRDVLAGLRGNP